MRAGGRTSWVEQWGQHQKTNSGCLETMPPPPLITLDEVKYLTKKLEEIESVPHAVKVYSCSDLSQEELQKLVPSLNGNGGANE